ncbi:MFS transporter [Vulcanimicrobium alpinum]|uniref:MFS transporter n=1 Tax=Vulcanimicrobium alpinum TaxID=3016050 RepID=A0AAN2C9H1_UNVUL|nr:MFS transporter [Vulcanimicrobium alpinum]BDE05983.1 MFS transporter [Vulcanimicrobium alpinum]
MMRLRTLAVAACGGSAFLDMYATQPLMPELRAAFVASEAQVGATIAVLTLACALAAPFVGSFADAVGRKRVIVGAILGLALVTFGAAHATTLPQLLAWRFAQGLFMPAVFAVTIAYVAEEFPAAEAGRAIGAYIGGNVLGGFLGRYLAALVTAHGSWQQAFVVLALLNLAGAAFVFAFLPRATRFVRAAPGRDALRAVGTFVRDPVLLSTFAVGASVLFSLTAAFTFATYYLAAPPFGLGTIALGNVFFVYLLGVIVSPLSGRLIDRIGHRSAVLAAIATSSAGVLLTLVPSVPAIVAGLAVMSTGVFAAQAASQAYIGVVARERRSTAASLYISVYYAGGGLGSVVPAVVWSRGGWPATVALILAVECFAAAAAATFWHRRAARTAAAAAIEVEALTP